MTQRLQDEIKDVANKQAGWHFSACEANIEQVEALSIADMAVILEQQAPILWALLGSLLPSDPSRACHQTIYWESRAQNPLRSASD